MKKTFLSCLFLVFGSPIYAHPPEGLNFSPLKFSPPKIEQRVLQCGATVYLLPDHELPLVELSVMIQTGSKYEPQDKVGMGSLCATLLRTGGTKNHTVEALDETLENMGASIEMGMETEQGTASLSVLSKDLDQGIQLLSEMLQFPKFDKKKFSIEKSKIIGAIYRRNDSPFPIAQREIRKLLYGSIHPLSRTLEIPTIKKISRKDLIKFHKKYYCPNNFRIAVSGDFQTEEILQKLDLAFKDWKNILVEYPTVPSVTVQEIQERKIALAEKKLSQSTIILAKLGVGRHNPDRFALEVMNEILGGSSFTSRLYKEVRSRKGLAYWIGSSFSEPWDIGTIGIGCQTKNGTVGEVIQSIQEISEQMVNVPVPEEELQAAKDAILNSFVFRYNSSEAIVTQKMVLDYFGYPGNYLETYPQKISKITSKEVQEAAKKYLKPKEMSIIAVGQSKEFDVPMEHWGTVKMIDLKIDE